MKRYLIASLLVLGALFLSTPRVAASTESTPFLQIKSVDIYLNSVLMITPDSEVYETCQISGPSGSTEWDGSCSEALPLLSARLREEHPLVAFNYIINGYPLGQI